MMEKKYEVTVAWGSKSFSTNCENARDAWDNFHVGMKNADDVFLWENERITVHYSKSLRTLVIIREDQRITNHLDAEDSLRRYYRLSDLYKRVTGKEMYDAPAAIRNYIYR